MRAHLIRAAPAVLLTAALATVPAAAQQTGKSLWDNSAFQTPYKPELSENERIAGLSKLWAEVKLNFANFDLVPDLRWDALYLETLPRVRQAKSTAEYYRILQEMVARLRDGHSNVYPPDETEGELNGRPLLLTRWIGGAVVITDLLGGELGRDGIRVGQEVVMVDGMPVQEYARKRVEPAISASTLQDLQAKAFGVRLLAGRVGEPVEITFRDVDGQEIVRRLPRLSYEERLARVKDRPPVAPLELNMLPGKSGSIAYIKLNSFETEEAAQRFEALFPEISKADALILDVRENGGGNSNVGFRILGHLTDRKHVVSRWRTREYRPSFRAWDAMYDASFGGETSLDPISGIQPYTRPVIVLLGPRTFSAAEDFAVAFDVMDRGRMIGEPTGGSTGQPLMFPLPGGGQARVCTKRDTYPDGREFVGVGVQPDRLVRPTLADFRAGKDPVLEAALEELRGGADRDR
jgi:C-terminal processing protease CtpA/Prc